MQVNPEKLKNFLTESGLVSEKNWDLAAAEAKETGRRAEDALLKRNLVSEEIVLKAKAYLLGIPFVDLANEIIDPELLRIIPEAIARHNHIAAFRKSGGNLEVAMLDPDDLQTIDFIKKKSGLNILPRLTTRASLESAIRQYQKSLEEEFSKIIKTQSSSIFKKVT